LDINDAGWSHAVLPKNRDGLMTIDEVHHFIAEVNEQAANLQGTFRKSANFNKFL